MYTQVKTAFRETVIFPGTVGIYKGLAMSPYLFNLVMEVLVRDALEEVPWATLFEEDNLSDGDQRGCGD